jgi:hypothetical protein
MANFEFIQENPVAGSGFVYKSETEAYYYNGSTVEAIRASASFTATTGSGTSTMTVASVESGSLFVGMTLTGTTPSRTISAFDTFDGTSGTITLSGSATWTSPAVITGFITSDSDYPATTVRGIVYLEGTYYVMTPNGSIYGSAINDPTDWSALNVIQCQGEPDGGIALARQLNLIVAFNSYSTEFFYNAGNPTGSPLLPYESAFIEVGCAVAESVSQTDNTLFFMGVTKQKGRGLYTFVGTSPEYVSNPFIDRIFNLDDLSDVNSFCIRIAGHVFYVIYLGDTGVTLVYDSTTKEWALWTVLVESESTITPTTAVWTNRQVVLTGAFSSLNDGDVVLWNNTIPSDYSGQWVINKTDDTTITIDFPTSAGTITNVGSITTFTEEPFTATFYTSGDNLDILQDSTNGYIYFMETDAYSDGESPIKFLARTFKFDAGTNEKKFVSRLEVIGDRVEGQAFVRYTNDDYQTYSKYRPVELEQSRSILNRLGQTRRRAFEVIHYENTPLRLETLEITVEQGE